MAQTSIDDLLARARDPAPGGVRALCSEPIKWYGYRREMYVDARGNIVTGIGHRLADAGAAVALPWRHRSTGRRASPSEIRLAFSQVRAQSFGHPAPAHQRASYLVLPAGFAADLAAGWLERTLVPALRRLFPGWDRYPLPAQRALVDMAWDLGPEGLALFHNLVAACARGDFAAAADHCHRRNAHSARNVSTRNLFREAAGVVTCPFVGKNARLDGGGR
jgi:GH24 family phage-related lysozyme (muramidase)